MKNDDKENVPQLSIIPSEIDNLKDKIRARSSTVTTKRKMQIHPFINL